MIRPAPLTLSPTTHTLIGETTPGKPSQSTTEIGTAIHVLSSLRLYHVLQCLQETEGGPIQQHYLYALPEGWQPRPYLLYAVNNRIDWYVIKPL